MDMNQYKKCRLIISNLVILISTVVDNESKKLVTWNMQLQKHYYIKKSYLFPFICKYEN